MHSIRLKLTLAFLVVILVCLVPTSLASAVIIGRYQQQESIDRLATIGQGTTAALATRPFVTQQQLQSEAELDATLDEQARATSTRVLIVDPHGLVRADTANKLVGQTWQVPSNVELPNAANPPGEPRRTAIRQTYKGKLVSPDDEKLAAVVYRLDARPPFPYGNRNGGANPADVLPPGTQVVVVAPWMTVGSTWAVLNHRLQSILFVALIFALALAFVLSRSLTSRLRTLTNGAHAMASGDYESALRLARVRGGNDEIGELADAFQTMAMSVSRVQQAQRDLVANVSHELKTPLTSIQGFSQAMIDGTVTDAAEGRELTEIIKQESLRMQRLVEQMLELSRLEAGTAPLEAVPIRVGEFIENIGRRYARLGEARGVSVQWSASAPQPLTADAGRLEQVLVNLLDNALQYTDAGGTITLHAGEMRAGWVDFTVRDTGRGIPTTDVPRLFERFYQVDRARAGQGRHVGLGLAIVREIVDAHHGTIHVDSALGEGTAVTVSVPLGQPAHGAENRPVAEGRPFERRAIASG